MSRRPAVMRDVSADRVTIANALGPKLGERFSINPAVATYAFVLRFPTNGPVTSRALAHALKKLPLPRGPVLLAAHDFTVEASQLARGEGCDTVSISEFGWTDERYNTRLR